MKESTNNYERPSIDVVLIEIEDAILQTSGQAAYGVDAPDLFIKEDIW